MARYRIEVNFTDCIACGVCYSLDPTHFQSRTDGKAQVVKNETGTVTSQGVFDDDELKLAQDAEMSCPVSVITVTELV